jgi:hypothetical protein
MNTDRIKQIQQETAYPESVSVQQALLKVWNETEQEQLRIGAVSGRSELLIVLQNIEKICDNQNPTHEQIWRIAYEAINSH